MIRFTVVASSIPEDEVVLEEHPEGEWVRYRHVEDMLTAATPEALEQLRGSLANNQLCVVRFSDVLDSQSKLVELQVELNQAKKALDQSDRYLQDARKDSHHWAEQHGVQWSRCKGLEVELKQALSSEKIADLQKHADYNNHAWMSEVKRHQESGDRWLKRAGAYQSKLNNLKNLLRVWLCTAIVPDGTPNEFVNETREALDDT